MRSAESAARDERAHLRTRQVRNTKFSRAGVVDEEAQVVASERHEALAILCGGFGAGERVSASGNRGSRQEAFPRLVAGSGHGEQGGWVATLVVAQRAPARRKAREWPGCGSRSREVVAVGGNERKTHAGGMKPSIAE